ncbi:zinc ABC transporter substrate-binding protein [Oceanobacillus sp. FSL K6-2867]|uniref:metal ABC transporter solute-binding protein, Zn/Mn family n=1 Tax=Oceanobacillus sp. FSL K6-2867 TaxID=2954748 RepID=UPI0030D80DF6
MKILKSLILIILFSILIAGCSSADQSSKANNGQLKIFTTLYPIQYAVERIGGDTVAAKTVYPPGVDAHSYEPTTKDITAIADSTAFIYLGAGMESFAESAAEALAKQDVQLIEIGEHEELFHVEEKNHEHGAISEDSHAHDGHHHGDHDPHIWIDPVRMIEMASIIKEELIALNPEKEAYYNENFSKLKTDLLALDEAFQGKLDEKKNKQILVSHAAFGYWEERYGIEQISINGLTSESEPSQKELTEIIDQANSYNLDYIIFEQNSSNRVSEVIQNEIGAENLMIHNLSVLTEDDIANDEDYLSLMQYNLDVLDQATK